jgi:predicted acylesterase/phospholipase RssA
VKLDRLALSLSGGGYRAAAFHLGVLTFLHRIDLLRNVRAISTASGGSIAAAFYAHSLARGETFEQFSARFKAFLRDVDVIDEALKRGGKLITAAADVYATAIDTTLGDLQRSHDHLEELAFNATDFTHGVAFRFVKTQSSRVRCGNKYVRVEPEVAEKIRVADAVAASSCFPGAFEPIIFPDDFQWRTGASPVPPSDVDRRGRLTSTGTPLMDGGIFDNSGIESLLLIRERTEIDAIIVCDADATETPLYREPRIRGGGFVRVWFVMMLLALIDAAAFVATWQSRHRPLPALFCAFIAIALTAFFVAAIRASRRYRPLVWRRAMRLTVRDLLRAIVLRASSVAALSSRVFMRRMRGLIYARAFRTSTAVIDNLLYELAEEGPTAGIRDLAKRASAMATTLWFDDEKTMNELIEVGEMTTCFNLLRRVEHEGCAEPWAEFTRKYR